MKDYYYFIDGGLPIKDYYSQFNTAGDLEVGKVYRQEGGIFYKDYLIIFIGEGVALGLEVANGNNNFSVGGKTLFHSEGDMKGWMYHDNRPNYRLLKEVK